MTIIWVWCYGDIETSHINLISYSVILKCLKSAIPETGDKMAVACTLTCIQSIHNVLWFLLENRWRANIYLEIAGSMYLSYNLRTSTSLKQSFSNVLVTYLYNFLISTVLQNMFKITKVYMLWRRWTNFTQSLVKQSRVYIIIVITDMNDRILNNITWYPLVELKAYPNQKIIVFKCCSWWGRI